MVQSSSESDIYGELYLDQLLIKKALMIPGRVEILPLKFDIKPLLQELFLAREALLNACLEDIRNQHLPTRVRKEARKTLQNVFARLRLFLNDELEEME